MTKTQYIDAAVDELLTTVSITEVQLRSNLDRLFTQAVEQFSRDVPYQITEVHTDVEDSHTITLNNDAYSSYLSVYYTDLNTGYRTDIPTVGFDYDSNSILFYHPLTYDTVTVEYCIKHTVDTSGSTIPSIYEYAFLYLLCAYEMQYDLYGSTSNIKSVDNGILKIQLGETNSTDTRQNMETYATRYYKSVKTKSTYMISDNPDDYLEDNTSEFGW